MMAESLKLRVITAAIFAAVFFAALFALPTRYFALFGLVILAGSAYEWAKLSQLSANGARAFAAVLAAIGVALLFAPGIDVATPVASPIVLALCGAATAFWLIIAPLWIRNGWPTSNPMGMLALGTLILLAMWAGLVNLHARSPWLLLATMAVVWLADTGAYFAGRKFGRRKLAPRVSPGKSWEGAIGGLICVAVYALAVAMLSPAMTPVRGFVVVFALLLAAISIVGDLYESWLKRSAGVKDSGALLPGHGGLLDRIDALMPVLPLATLAAALMS
jgi:phosphatidate cytidylyltransferase